jgi:hypothetical protein
MGWSMALDHIAHHWLYGSPYLFVALHKAIRQTLDIKLPKAELVIE